MPIQMSLSGPDVQTTVIKHHRLEAYAQEPEPDISHGLGGWDVQDPTDSALGEGTLPDKWSLLTVSFCVTRD